LAESKAVVMRWRRGQDAAARKQRELLAAGEVESERAVAEALAGLEALEAMGVWPGPRDPYSEHAVEVVRRRWARIQTRARETARRRPE
jgi:hypothetical protein